MSIPRIGEDVTITIVDSSPAKTGPLAHLCSDTIDIVGKVVHKPEWDKDPNNFAVFVRKSNVELRIINIFRVKAINGMAVGPIRPPRLTKESFTVKGSQAATYTVTRDGEKWKCNCQGFHFRKTCRHITETIAKEQS